MKVLKKIFIVIGSILVLLILLSFGLSYYVTKKLPTIIKDQKDFPYNVSYKNLDINLISGSFAIQNAYLAPKDSLQAAMKQGAFARVESIEVNNFSVWAVLFNNHIKVNEVIITKPEIILYHRKEKYDTQKDFVKPFENSITTKSLTIKQGSFKMVDSLLNPKLTAGNINFTLTNIKIDSTSLKKDVPIRYRDYSLSCDSLFYDAGKFYTIAVNRLSTTDSNLSLKDFAMKPKQNRVQFTKMQAKELDQFNLRAGSVSIPNLDWGYIRDTLYVHAPEMTLDKVYANIYRSKVPADDYSRKKLYSEMLRTMKFDIDVKKLNIINTTIEYEEQLSFAKPAAKVTFTKFDAKIANVYSPIGKPKSVKLPSTVLDVKCIFMKSSPLRVTWSFNTLDESDAFSIMGHLQNIDSERVDPVTTPLMNAKTNGTIKEVKFNMNGNAYKGKGTFAINYDDLTVDLLKKDGKKENKLMSTVANMVVKNDTDGKLKQTNVEVDRIRHKSVFNFLWRFVEQGLKQSVLPKVVVNIADNKKEKKDKEEKSKTTKAKGAKKK